MTGAREGCLMSMSLHFELLTSSDMPLSLQVQLLITSDKTGTTKKQCKHGGIPARQRSWIYIQIYTDMIHYILKAAIKDYRVQSTPFLCICLAKKRSENLLHATSGLLARDKLLQIGTHMMIINQHGHEIPDKQLICKNQMLIICTF